MLFTQAFHNPRIFAMNEIKLQRTNPSRIHLEARCPQKYPLREPIYSYEHPSSPNKDHTSCPKQITDTGRSNHKRITTPLTKIQIWDRRFLFLYNN